MTEWVSFCAIGATRGTHVVRVVMPDGRVLERTLRPATYVNVYVEAESLAVRYETE
jgi:hypothetical protein